MKGLIFPFPMLVTRLHVASQTTKKRIDAQQASGAGPKQQGPAGAAKGTTSPAGT